MVGETGDDEKGLSLKKGARSHHIAKRQARKQRTYCSVTRTVCCMHACNRYRQRSDLIEFLKTL